MQAPQTEVLVRAADGSELLRMMLGPGDYVLGRDPACELPCTAELVSRRHAQLTINFDHALIEDLGSSNGTTVNGRPVTAATRLWPGQKIQLGTATVELRRQKTLPLPDVSLAPSVAITRDILPEEILRDRRYDIGGVVAQGGMGAILSAQEASIDRGVAMKVMLDGSSPDDLVRFIAEARVTGQLEHPNIVPVHELGVDENDQVFYTMKFVKGITLKKVLELMAAGTKETLAKYPLGTLLTIFQKVCDAVAFAHSKGVIHRDLKPENIMLGDFGEVLLMDWGLAKVVGRKEAARPASAAAASDDIARSLLRAMPEASGATLGGTIMGTPQYMAPEQARGEVDDLDHRADIYALGAILYHVLALRPSVQGDDAMAIVEKVARGEIDPLLSPRRHEDTKRQNGDSSSFVSSSLRGYFPGGRIPASLAAVVRKAMALDPAQRYAAVADLQADLAAYQTGFATKAEQAGLAKQLVLLVKRNKGIFTTAAAAWLLITALAVWFVINLRVKERRAVAGEASAKAAEAVAVEKGEAARQSLAKSALNLAEAAQREGNGPEMQAALNDVPEDLRDSTWNYLLEQADTSIVRVRTSTNVIHDAAADPRRPGVFAVSDDKGKVTVLEVRTGARLLEFTPGLGKGRLMLVFSPDGERIAVGLWDSGRLKAPSVVAIYSARDGQKLVQWEAPGSERLEFSPDGQRLLQTTIGANQIHLWDTKDGQLGWSYPPAPGGAVYGTFSADGQQVVTTDTKENLRLVSAQDGTLIRALPSSRAWVRALETHPDGTVTAVGDNDTVMRIDFRAGRVLADFRTGDGLNIKHFALTPDGRRIVTVTKIADGRQNIRLWDASGGALVQSLLGGSGDFFGIDVHPLSGELLVSGPNARAWSLTGTPERWTMTGGSYTWVAFWGSDDLILAPAAPGVSGLRKLQGGSPTTLWKPASGIYRYSAVSADGRFAAMANVNTVNPILLLRNPGPAVEQVATFQPRQTVDFMRLSPTGDRLVVIESGRRERELFDTATGQQPVALERKEVKRFWDLGWLDGQRLLGLVTAKTDRGEPGSEEWIVVWDATTGKILQTVTNRTALGVLALAPDGRRFAEAGADRKVRIRDAATLAVEQEFRAHDGPITALAWHPTKPIVATTSADLAIRVWNLDTGRRLEELRGPLAVANSLVFSPSGHRLACSAADGVTRIWEPQSLNDQPATP